ncbi:ABC transporter substrate-binding protein [Halosimplex aquaticum]
MDAQERKPEQGHVRAQPRTLVGRESELQQLRTRPARRRRQLRLSGTRERPDRHRTGRAPVGGLERPAERHGGLIRAGRELRLDVRHQLRGDKVDPWFHADHDNGVVPARAGKLRQAIAHVISESDIIQNQLGSRAASAISPWKKQTLIGTPAAADRFPDVVSKLETTSGQNTDVATKRMESVGLTKENGKWVKPNGEQLSLTIQSYASNRAMFETIKEDLNSFGIAVEHSTPESSVVFSELSEGSFGAAQVWTSADGPYEGEVEVRFSPSAWYDSRRVIDYEIPPEIGDYEGEASETFNAGEAWKQLATQSVEENDKVLPKIIWTFAYHMPNIILFPYPNQTMVNTRHFEWPQPMPEKASNGVATATDEHHPVWGATENWRQLRRGIPSITGKPN